MGPNMPKELSGLTRRGFFTAVAAGRAATFAASPEAAPAQAAAPTPLPGARRG
jgi:hypothetical protein